MPGASMEDIIPASHRLALAGRHRHASGIMHQVSAKKLTTNDQ